MQSYVWTPLFNEAPGGHGADNIDKDRGSQPRSETRQNPLKKPNHAIGIWRVRERADEQEARLVHLPWCKGRNRNGVFNHAHVEEIVSGAQCPRFCLAGHKDAVETVFPVGDQSIAGDPLLLQPIRAIRVPGGFRDFRLL